MTDQRVADLFLELEQICEQYKEQVPGRRRAWPRAVKDRIGELQRLGISGHQISKRVPIPYMTIASWRRDKPESGSAFLPVKIVEQPTLAPARATTVTVEKRERGRPPIQKVSIATTVTVVAPNGLRIEGLPVDAALRLLRGAR